MPTVLIVKTRVFKREQDPGSTPTTTLSQAHLSPILGPRSHLELLFYFEAPGGGLGERFGAQARSLGHL